jgi:hypothetical protein
VEVEKARLAAMPDSEEKKTAEASFEAETKAAEKLAEEPEVIEQAPDESALK